MRQGHFSGPRHAAAADNGDIRGGVMRRPERPLGDNAVGIFKQAGDGMDLGGL